MNTVPLREDEFQELRRVCCELRARLRAGESVRVEELLEIHPLLARNDEAVLDSFAATSKDPAGFELLYLNRLIEQSRVVARGT
jgi:hypothetical protein